jgi:hypothetical protein
MSLRWMSDVTRGKKSKLEDEINRVPDKTLRINLIHTWHKFLIFLDEDVEYLRKRPGQKTLGEVLE